MLCAFLLSKHLCPALFVLPVVSNPLFVKKVADSNNYCSLLYVDLWTEYGL